MLAADKLQLQSALKQQATALKEKEFQLHHSNLLTVGTQAAVLAGLDITMFIEFNPPHDSEWGLGGRAYLIPRTLKFFYYVMIVTACCCNILVVAQTTLLSVLGTALALRGPDGSMITATDGLYNERKDIFLAFGVGLATTIGSVLMCVWLILSPEAALICMSITVITCFRLYHSYLRITGKFVFDESETVDFTDIFEGPAALKVVPTPHASRHGSRRGSRHGIDSDEEDSLGDLVNDSSHHSTDRRNGGMTVRRIDSRLGAGRRKHDYSDDDSYSAHDGYSSSKHPRRRERSISPLLTV